MSPTQPQPEPQPRPARRASRPRAVRFSSLERLLRPAPPGAAAVDEAGLERLLHGGTEPAPVPPLPALDDPAQVPEPPLDAPPPDSWDALEPPPQERETQPGDRRAPGPAGSYSMRVRKDAVEFEVHGDRDFVLAEGRRLLQALILSGPVAPAPAASTPSAEQLRDSLMDFLASISVSGHPETILALAYFLGERGHSPLGVADVEACYELLGIPYSSNFNADFNSLVRRKLLVEASRGGPASRKAWLLSEQGLAYIHDKLRSP
jgi:hypothetical protein